MRKKRDTAPAGANPPQTPKAAPSAAQDVARALTQPQDAQDLHEAGPVTPSPHLLSPAHQRFAQAYAASLNGTKAYMEAYPDANNTTARARAAELLQFPAVRAHIQELLDERATILGITADRVLVKLWETATANPRELVDIKVGACRFCWGLYNQWQYTEAEFEKAQHEHVTKERKTAKAEGRDYEPTPCPEKGGTGYSPNRTPNPDCPECHGDGTPRSILKDLRHASPGALSLFGGLRITESGKMTVIVRDQLPAMKLVAEHLGLLSDKLPGPQVGNPLEALLQAIRGETGAGSALAVVHNDPERVDLRDISDVTPKSAPTKEKKPQPAPVAGRKPWKAAK